MFSSLLCQRRIKWRTTSLRGLKVKQSKCACLKTVESLSQLLPVQEALWGKPRSSKANKRSAARLLHEPLSYNTAGFLFSCLNTFYMLSARTRLNNRTQGGETREDKRLVQRQNASNHNKSNVASNPVCES